MVSIVSDRRLCNVVKGGLVGDPAMSWVSSQQLGLITTHQTRLCGISRHTVDLRLARGLLHPAFRSVYFVGHPTPLPRAWELAGVLACGAQTVVSHRSALWLWQLIDRRPDVVEVTVAGRRCRSRSGLVVHKVDAIATYDRTTFSGIPVTTPARALLDFAATADRDDLERALAEAIARELTSERKILHVLERSRGRAGAPAIRACLDTEGGPAYTRSEAERRMLALIRAADLPPPVCNQRLEGHRPDFLWREQRLIVEVDSFQFHGGRRVFELDRRKTLVFAAAGYRVIRITWRQLVREPLFVAAKIAAALAQP